jgi:hypothetical protein
MKKKIMCITILLLAYSNLVLSQENFQLPNVNGIAFSSYFEKYFRDNFDKRLSTLGIDGVCWIKFKILENGKLSQLEISPNTNDTLYTFLLELMNTTNGLWKNNIEYQWIILPFKYSLQNNGKTKTTYLNPYDMNLFLSDTNNSNCTYIYLPVQEYISPFDKIASRKLISTKR